ncbi:MAG: hypothetical protein JST22_12775 [Bacteroidetes bacterium]|nr:hypothetical protein [Bacteroidota bacterium]
MANKNPYQGRLRRKVKRSAGDVDRLREKLWKALERAEGLMDNDDAALVLRAIHALAQATGPYLKAVEVGELEARLRAIEEKMNGNGETHEPTETH